MRVAETAGNRVAVLIKTMENNNDNAMMPMVGGHLINRKLTYENKAPRQMINVMISYESIK